MRLNTAVGNTDIGQKCDYYKNLLNQIPDLIFQLRITVFNEFYIDFMNDSLKSFFELNEFELQGNLIEVISNRIHPDDRESVILSLYKAKSSAKNWSYEFRVIYKKTEINWLKIDAKIEKDENKNTLFYGRLTNITEIKNRELKVYNSEARIQFALQASKNGVWDYNIKTGKVYFSKESLEIIQCNESDHIETNSAWDDRIHPEDLESYKENIELHKKNKIPFFENTKRILAKDGSYKWVLSRGKIIERDHFGNPIRIVGTHTDVSLDKEKERELLQNIKIINQQNDRLLNFAHIVSHNLRSHTGNIKMLLNLLEEEDDMEAKDECFSCLKTTSTSLSETIEHLKELVDIHSNVIHKKESLNLKQYLHQTLELLNKDIKENQVTIIDRIDENHTVKFNPAYLESVLLNFTTNAIKYSHPDRKGIIEYSSEKINNEIILSIKDNGLGIDLNRYGLKLFGMYKTFHRNENSRGIGLFITKNQIESMGGTVDVTSKVNIGTTFVINFKDEI